MNERINVLGGDGYVEVVESWGCDERIIESARMSTGKGFQGWGGPCPHCSDGHLPVGTFCGECQGRGTTVGDEKLLKYLYENEHMTPFEMAGMTIEVQAPIFVFREWHRHRTQSYNEMSSRYVPLPDVNYVPTIERLLMDGGTNKQAQSSSLKWQPGEAAWYLSDETAPHVVQVLLDVYSGIQDHYENLLKAGVPKELARIILPVGRYSRMRASANLRNWLGFMTLRCEEHAQWEIRQFANAVSYLVGRRFPRTHQLWEEGMKR